MLLNAAERRLGLADKPAAVICNPRDRGRVTRARADGLRARIFASPALEPVFGLAMPDPERTTTASTGALWSLDRLSRSTPTRLIGGLDCRLPRGRCQLCLCSQARSSAASSAMRHGRPSIPASPSSTPCSRSTSLVTAAATQSIGSRPRTMGERAEKLAARHSSLAVPVQSPAVLLRRRTRCGFEYPED
jgi:hypothetical protein